MEIKKKKYSPCISRIIKIMKEGGYLLSDGVLCTMVFPEKKKVEGVKMKTFNRMLKDELIEKVPGKIHLDDKYILKEI